MADISDMYVADANEADLRVMPVGTVLNEQYVIEGILGEGGFGITYLATDQFLKVKVAIKEYFPTQYAMRNTANGTRSLTVINEYERFYQKELSGFSMEANKMAKLKRLPGFVSVLNFFYENNTAYMVMNFIEGETLKKYMKDNGGKIGWEDTLRIMRSVIESMAYVHREGIIHRDISPDNIMISRDGQQVTIIDFGAARMYESDQTKTIMLKHGYAPPEQYYKKGKQGPWTDVYALCATIYMMITGEKVPNSLALLERKSEFKPINEFDRTIPQNISDAISAGLNPIVNDRVQSMEELFGLLYGNMKVDKKKVQKRGTGKLPAIIAGGVVAVAAIVAVIVFVVPKFKGDSSGNNKVVVDANGDVNIESETDDNTKTNKVTQSEVVEEIPDTYKDIQIVHPDDIYVSEIDGGLKVDGVNKKILYVALPNEINGVKIKEIAKINTNIISMRIPNGIETIDANAFKNCIYLENLYIPATVSYIGEGAFTSCSNIKEIYVSQNSTYYYVKDNTLFDNAGREIVKW